MVLLIVFVDYLGVNLLFWEKDYLIDLFFYLFINFNKLNIVVIKKDLIVVI